MNKKINVFYILLILIPAFVVFMPFFKSLHLVWGDAPYYFPEGLKEIVSYPSIWTQKGIDFGGRNLALWLSPLMILYGSLNKYFGLGNDIIIRILFYFPSVILAGLGPYFLTRYLKFSKTVQFFSSLFYLLNTYFLLLIDGGQVGIALAYGIFPFTILFWKKFTDKLSVSNFFIAFLATLVLGFIDPRIAAISFVLIFLWQIVEGVNPIWVFVAGILLIPFNLYWLLPLIKGGTEVISVSVSELRLSSLLNSLFLFAPHWPSNMFGKVVGPYFYFSLIPIFIFGGFLFKRINKKYYFLALAFLLFGFLSKGSTPPMGGLYEFFVNRIPLGSAFRDSSKFFVPMLLTGSILIGHTVDNLLSLSKRRMIKVMIFGVSYLYLLLLIFPAIQGKLNFNLSSKDYGSDYQIVYEHLKNEGGNFRTLWFNEKPQIAFETSDKPALSANQLAGTRPFAAINEGEDVYNFLNNPGFPDWLNILGIKYVFLSGDPRNIYPTEKDSQNWDTENKLIAGAPGLIKENWGTKLPIYKIDNPRPEIYSVKSLALVVGPDLFPTGQMPIAVYAEDGKFDPKVLESVRPDSLKIIFNQGGKSDLAMSFLQRYFKSPAGAFKSEWSIFGPGQYLKYKYELLIRDFKFRDFDYGKGLAFSTKAGEKISFTFDVPTDGNYVIAKRTGNIQKQKLSWNFETKALKAGKFEYKVENSSGFDVLNTVAVIPWSEFDDAAKLADVYISTFGTAGDLGTSISGWHEVKIKNITDGDHWLIYTQNFDPDWKSGLSGPHLPVFSMINGFYLGQENKVTLDFAGQKSLDLGIKISLSSIFVLLMSYLAYAISRRAK